MRLKYKPGCITPYVALKMQSVGEYLQSERIYLEQKEKHPILTDVRFFFKAVYNILTRKIVSGWISGNIFEIYNIPQVSYDLNKIKLKLR